MSAAAGSNAPDPDEEPFTAELLLIALERAKASGPFFNDYELETDGANCKAAENYFRTPIEAAARKGDGYCVSNLIWRLPALPERARIYADVVFCRVLLALERMEIGARGRTDAVAILVNLLTAARCGGSEQDLTIILDSLSDLP